MAYRSDRHRVEVSFVAKIIHSITVHGMKFTSNEAFKQVSDIAYSAAIEPFADCTEKKRESLLRRVERMEAKTIVLYKSVGMMTILTSFRLITHLIDNDYLDVPDETIFSQTVNALMTFVDEIYAEYHKEKTVADALEWLGILQADGYYVGCPIVSRSADHEQESGRTGNGSEITPTVHEGSCGVHGTGN